MQVFSAFRTFFSMKRPEIPNYGREIVRNYALPFTIMYYF